MANFKRVSPAEAKELVDAGYTYVDVRSVEEFHGHHPAGAVNVPVAPERGGPPHDFLAVMQRLFSSDARIVVGCAAGMRSQRAAEILVGAGFTQVIDQRAGMGGARNAFGQLVEPGWAAAGLPVSQGPDAGSLAAITKPAS